MEVNVCRTKRYLPRNKMIQLLGEVLAVIPFSVLNFLTSGFRSVSLLFACSCSGLPSLVQYYIVLAVQVKSTLTLC